MSTYAPCIGGLRPCLTVYKTRHGYRLEIETLLCEIPYAWYMGIQNLPDRALGQPAMHGA